MKKLRVLLVDDEIMIREGFKRLFDWEAHDCQVVGEAADGMETLTQIDLLRPDIIIMDINIPIMNGLKVIQLSRIKHPGTAFVIVSGYDDFSYCREALRLQITDYILKPVNYEEFGSCIDNLKISLFEQRVSAEEEPEQGEERTITGITRYLQEHLAEEMSLSVLAEEFHLNPQYISQLFKNEIGVGFLAYLTNIRMEKAKKLLLSTSLSIAEVAEQSGYGDYRVFTKVFKKTDLLTKAKSLPPLPVIVLAIHWSSKQKKMACTILLRFNDIAARRHSSVAARMPLFRIFEIQCSRFKTEKLPSAQIFRSRIMDRNSGVPTR